MLVFMFEKELREPCYACYLTEELEMIFDPVLLPQLGLSGCICEILLLLRSASMCVKEESREAVKSSEGGGVG